MCISTAYNQSENGEILAEYIASIKQQGNTIIMTDIMGKDTTVQGVLLSADLTRGTLIIKPQ